MKLKVTALFIVLAGVFIYFVFKGNYISFEQTPSGSAEVSTELNSQELLNQFYSSDLRDYEGNKLSMNQASLGVDKNVIVHLWASWCAPCVNEVPELIAYSKKHPDVKFIIISLDQDKDDIKKFLKSFPEFGSDKFVKIWDWNNQVSKITNADRLPMSIIIRDMAKAPQVVQSVVDWKYLEL